MNKEMYIYEIFKDKGILRKKFEEEIDKKYELKKEKIDKIYNKIVNYQIKKYGKQLYGSAYESFYEKKKKIEAHRQRRRRKIQ